MVKEELFNKKKEEYIKSNRKIAIAFFLTNIFFTLLWIYNYIKQPIKRYRSNNSIYICNANFNLSCNRNCDVSYA